jgi:spore coat polysaccharide biosynthesis protein SpsF
MSELLPPAYRTEQDQFWAGQFGTDYINRNRGAELLASNLNFFATALRRAGRIESCIEFGANVGMNFEALSRLFPHMQQRGIEINADAARVLREVVGAANVYCGSIHDYPIGETADLVLTKGVLIHIDPDMLAATYQKLFDASHRYLLVCEYYNPSPTAITYRGHTNRLFKRDFAGELLDQFPQLHLVDYGFAYHRDPAFPQDDITWFLMQKRP